jgi:hypothetical protein
MLDNPFQFLAMVSDALAVFDRDEFSKVGDVVGLREFLSISSSDHIGEVLGRAWS